MSNYSEIIHIESLRKQLLNQIEVLDNQIANLNQSVKQKGLEINQSQIENTLNTGKFQNQLKASEIEVLVLSIVMTRLLLDSVLYLVPVPPFVFESIVLNRWILVSSTSTTVDENQVRWLLH